MITFPCAKINLGLNVVRKREDGYHDIETVMYPLPLTDALEVKLMGEAFPSDVPCDLKVTGQTVDCPEADNLCVKAYHLLAADYKLPRVHLHLVKRIPSQAGLGGGSADAAFALRLLDERFRLNLGIAEMERYAARLGSDCPFFISAEPAYASGRGEVLMPAEGVAEQLRGLWIVVVKPEVSVSTAQAYSLLTPASPAVCCREVVRQPITTWREQLSNDFEQPVFAQHPALAAIKASLYDMGAIYAQMSGSGSAFFGLFTDRPKGVEEYFGQCFTFVSPLG